MNEELLLKNQLAIMRTLMILLLDKGKHGTEYTDNIRYDLLAQIGATHNLS